MRQLTKWIGVRTGLPGWILLILSMAVVAQEPQPQVESRLLPPHGPTDAEYPALHNLMQVTATIYSGAEPQDEVAFANLAELGVHTVLSVDGATPHIALARKYGIRYIHVPFGYDGIPPEAAAAITRAVRECDSPLYIHCHHGKHRGPAAAAIASVAAGCADGKTALKVLENGGTSHDYTGLWRDVAAFVPPAANAQLPELHEISPVDSLAGLMARIDRNSDDLKLLAANSWNPLPDHLDLFAVPVATLLLEGLRESGRLQEVQDAELRKWLSSSEQTTTQLVEALKTNDTAKASRLFEDLQGQCKQCHKAHRDH